MMMDLLSLTIEIARGLLARREVTSVELTEAALARIEAVDGELHAFLRVDPDLALLQAQHADERIARGEAGPVTGIPMGLKDILSTRGIPTTCGSRILADYVPQYDATVVARLREAGAVLLGKTN